MKERVGSSARNVDGEDGTNDVHATNILGSRLGSPDGFGYSPVGHAVLDVPLEVWQCAVREVVGSCVFCSFPFVRSGGRGPCRPDGCGCRCMCGCACG